MEPLRHAQSPASRAARGISAPGGIDAGADSLVVMSAGNGQSGTWNSWTSPLSERTDGPNPSSAVFGTASGIESTAQTSKTYIATASVADILRGTGIVGVWGGAAPPPPSTYDLTVTKAGTGSGTITSSPSGINCGADCSETYTDGTAVSLTATPAGGSSFTGWSGACSGTGACNLTMSANRSVTATFDITPLPVANDDFTQGSNVTLVSHTPTGPGAGNGWIVQISGGNITDLSTGKITDSSGSNGNRYKMSNNLGSDQMNIQADFTSAGSSGSPVFFGLIGRLSSATGSSAIEGHYDHSVSGGSWIIGDGTTSASLAQAWPGGTVTMKLEVRSGVSNLYANGVLKVTLNTNKCTGQNYAGIFLGNFSGGAGKMTADNYQSTGI